MRRLSVTRMDPDEVQRLLQAAYGEEYGKTGHQLAGHTVVAAEDVASAFQGGGSSLLYGTSMR
ncbi:unnamed protein product [Effrenium voratum]|nr:unnamed protein product [Effrenium voratum]